MEKEYECLRIPGIREDIYIIEKISILKNKCIKNKFFESADQFRTIEQRLMYRHKIEEIFEVRHQYTEIVKIEIEKIIRKKKLSKIIKNNKINDYS